MNLSAEELRVLGCLIEKEATTPDQYPLSTNGLVTACSQKSNREPVMEFNQRLVLDTMMLLRPAGLARTIAGGRTDKHKHVCDEALGFDRDQLAVLAVMMLRGPQSPGELKTRTDRYPTSHGTGFETLGDIERTLAGLAMGDDPFVVNIGRASGQSQDRWAHCLGEEIPDVNDVVVAAAASSSSDRGPSLTDRVAELEARLASIEEALGLSMSPTSDSDAEPDASTETGELMNTDLTNTDLNPQPRFE